MKRSKVYYRMLLLFIGLTTTLNGTSEMIASIEWINRERSLDHVQLVAISEAEIVIRERFGTALVERHVDHTRIRRLTFERTPYCETAMGHYRSGDRAAAFEQWERIWNNWQLAAEKGWIDPQWKSAWWEVLERSNEVRSNLDTLLFAESFAQWFDADRAYRTQLYQLIAEKLIELDQRASARPYLDAIADDTFPHPPQALHPLRFQLMLSNGNRQAALDAWLDNCVLTGSCDSPLLQILLDDWDAQPEWRALEPPKSIQLHDRDNTSFNHAP